MRNIVSVLRLLDLVEKTADKEEIEVIHEARALSKAIKRGTAEIEFHVKVEQGDITCIRVGNLKYNAFGK